MERYQYMQHRSKGSHVQSFWVCFFKLQMMLVRQTTPFQTLAAKILDHKSNLG